MKFIAAKNFKYKESEIFQSSVKHVILKNFNKIFYRNLTFSDAVQRELEDYINWFHEEDIKIESLVIKNHNSCAKDDIDKLF